MAKKIFFLMNRCLGCEECIEACKKEHSWLSFGHVEWIKGIYPIQVRCAHCDDPACLKSCPVEGAITKREDGVVLINQEKCIGCRNCEFACPFGIPQYIEPLRKVFKCDMCIHRIDEGNLPACVENCPTQTLLLGDDTEVRISTKPKAIKRSIDSKTYLDDVTIAQEG
ncbi:MAG: 4Fe-4S dicluster domain-containing protein [Promethearchaeota archaeon]